MHGPQTAPQTEAPAVTQGVPAAEAQIEPRDDTPQQRDDTAQQRTQSHSITEQEIPAGDPFDLIPMVPLDGFWGFIAEATAAKGVRTLSGFLMCVPVVGPIAYVLMSPGLVVDALDYTATNLTSTDLGDRDAALGVAYVVSFVEGCTTLAAQTIPLSLLAVLVVAVAMPTQNMDMSAFAGVWAGVTSLALLALYAAVPIQLLVTTLGPFVETWAYHGWSLAGSDYGDEEEGN
jgi:hypothetical protein